MCEGSGEVLIEANILSGHAVAVVSRAAAPSIVGNTFRDVELVLEVSGAPLPPQVRLNAVEGSQRRVVNRAAEPLAAIGSPKTTACRAARRNAARTCTYPEKIFGCF